MKDIRKAVKAKMKKLDYSPYKMAKMLKEKGVCVKSTFYNFYHGQNEIGSGKLQGIFALLELDVVSKDT